VADGIVDDPRKCHFDPKTLICQGADADTCLTSRQAAALRKVYDGPRDRAGRQMQEGFLPGGETGPLGWSNWITGTAPGKSAQYAFASGAFDGYSGDFRTFDFDRDFRRLADTVETALNADDPNLAAFYKRGGKLILYQGWSDPAIPPTGTIHYFESVVERVGADQARDFVRLYMVPGMQHLRRGAGSQLLQSFADTGAGREPQHVPGAGGVDRTGRGAGPDRRGSVQSSRESGQRRAANPSAVLVSADRPLQGCRQHRPGGQLRLRGIARRTSA
jgi:Tannase and feruloyl esterase